MRWLTSGEQEENTLLPNMLPNITDEIANFVKDNENSIILLEGIEYLIDQNDFKSILNMIYSINDSIMRSSSILIIPLDPYIQEYASRHNGKATATPQRHPPAEQPPVKHEEQQEIADADQDRQAFHPSRKSRREGKNQQRQ